MPAVIEEQFADVGQGIKLCYQSFGDAGDPTVLLIMGLGTQLLGWHHDFCAMVAERGFRVVRFDNRDIGRSTHLDQVPPPNLGQILRRRVRAGYLLSDMAQDAAGLLDALDAPTAHVVGASMGGMIAQTLAAREPDRVESLVSIMSSTGNRWVGQPRARTYPIFLKAPPRGREAYVEHTVRLFGVIGSPGFERDDESLRQLAGASYDRGRGRAGTMRQLAAIIASGDRTAELRRIVAPTLVIHGAADGLIASSGGRATAKAIPGAKLLPIAGMGHDLPRGAWQQIVDGIVATAALSRA
ncbi:MAG: alpha/beta fold hydrolase [Solirubrobacteraceae bacterium]